MQQVLDKYNLIYKAQSDSIKPEFDEYVLNSTKFKTGNYELQKILGRSQYTNNAS